MSSCDLSLELDRNPPVYRPGDQVRGKLHVFVNDSCQCDALTVTLQWRTHGKGNKDKGPEDILPLGVFRWLPGESSVHDFAFTLPSGPVTYHGQIVNVDWYLLARADVPWAIDPKIEQDIVLLPAPPETNASTTYRGGPQLTARTHDLGPGSKAKPQALWMKAGAVALFHAFFLVFFGSHLMEDGQPNWVLMAFYTVALVMTGKMLWPDVRNLTAKRKLGDIRITADPPDVMRGQSLTIRAGLEPLSRARLAGVTASLIGEEVAVSGSGTSRTTHRHPLATVKQEMSGALQLFPGQPVELTCTLKVPDDAPPTFRSSDNDVRWRVAVHFDIEGWPDLEEVVDVTVMPSGEPSLSSN